MDASRYRPEIQADLEQDPRYLEWRRAQSEPPQTENVLAEAPAVYVENDAPPVEYLEAPPTETTSNRDQNDGLTARQRSLANLRPIQPGQVLNPYGRPKGAIGFAKHIQRLTNDGEALAQFAWSIAKNERAADKDRLRAIEFLATRAFGAPLQLIRVLDEAEIERRSREAGVDPELVKQHLRSQQK